MTASALREYTMDTRAGFYNRRWPERPPVAVHGDYMYGVWKIGNDYTNATSYYGAYPHGYLDRVMSMFPDAAVERTLHLFSGSVGDEWPGVKFDVAGPEGPGRVRGNAESLSAHFAAGSFDLILADPPYSGEDALHYGTPMVNRNVVVRECAVVLTAGGYLVWLDQVWPMYRKSELKLVGEIGVVRSTNHRSRHVWVWRRLGGGT